ncbi:unnamed protein product [Arabis nemorensis]|uniref:RNase H type-1 domain-containing protein n=1 Tax=Arabis nemorensis TaxID=586526 RepID=A0A565CMV6_9BRAS|nr:unnamed protein product [Arabis nemorensis]
MELFSLPICLLVLKGIVTWSIFQVRITSSAKGSSHSSASRDFTALSAETLALKTGISEFDRFGIRRLNVFFDCKVLCLHLSAGSSPLELKGLLQVIRSIFGPYVHRPLQTQCSVSPISDQRKNVAASQDDNIVLINKYNSSKTPPNAPRRNEAGFFTRADSPAPPFSKQMNFWPGQSSYLKPIPVNTIQFKSLNAAYASAMAPASVSPSPSSVSRHEYSSRFHPFNGRPEGFQERDGSADQDKRRHISSATKQSAVGNHCSGNYIDHQQQLEKKKNEDGYPSSVGKI